MISKHLEKIKNIALSEGKSNKRKMENLVVLIIILIITFFAVDKIWSGDSKKRTEENIIQNGKNKKLAMDNAQYDSGTENNLEKELEDILSKISGVGNVNVLLTYSETSSVVPLYDETTNEKTTEEADTSGGKRVTTDTSTQKSTVMQENNGEKKIITQKTVSPKIEGAIIIADGGDNTQIKAQIVQAVEAATGVSAHKIQVFKAKSN